MLIHNLTLGVRLVITSMSYSVLMFKCDFARWRPWREVLKLSRQTTTLRYILESKIGLNESVGYSQIANVIAQARPIIFDFDYPIFDSEYKSVLETKFLRHFYTREICVTPFGKWKLWLEDELNIIMPYYNQLYESEKIKFDPLTNTMTSRTGNKKENGNRKDNGNSSSTTNQEGNSTQNVTGKTDSSNTTESTDNSMDAYQDTPQSSLNGVENLTYLTNARNIKNSGTVTDDGVSNNTSNSTSKDTLINNGSNEFSSLNEYSNLNEYMESITGKVGDASYSSLLNDFRTTFINIDQMVLKDLSGLFMGIFSGGDVYD